MKSISTSTVAIFASLLATSSAFSPVQQYQGSSTVLNAYVPDGLTAEQYQAIKKQEKNKYAGKNLGALGPRGFQSRSMEAWQKAYEKGQASHSFAPFNFRERLSKGEISVKDVPYMVRGGHWDNRDVKGSKRTKWTREDRAYANGGYKKEQSVSILGSGPGLDWTGTQNRDAPRRIIPGFS